MSVNVNFLDYVVDQLSEAGPVEARRMFGGAGLYLNGLFFGLISDDILYFKVDESNREDYTGAGMEPFRPFGTYSMNYYRVPEGVLEDSGKLTEWARKSVMAAAKKGAAVKKKKKSVNEQSDAPKRAKARKKI